MKRLCEILIVFLLLATTAFAAGYRYKFSWSGKRGFACSDILPIPGLVPSSVAFGNHSTGTTADSTITVSNTGNGQLSAASLAVSGTGFALYSTTCGSNPFNLAAESNCTATVRFAPETAEELTGSLTLSAPNLDNVVASLSGTGTEAAPAGPLLSDTFDTDTLSNYTVFTATAPVYDVTNHRVKGQSGSTYHGIYYPTAAATNNYEISCLAYYYSSGYSSPFFNGDGSGTSSTGYYVNFGNTTAALYRRNSDASATFVSAWTYSGGKTWTASTAHRVKIVVTSGATFHLYIDFDDNLSFADADEDLSTKTDSTYSGNYSGLMLYGLSSYADNITIQEN